MSGFLVHVGANVMCQHGAPTTITASSGRVKVNGQPAVTVADQYIVSGCPFTVPPGKPQPCVQIKWIKPASRVLIDGKPAVLQSSSGLCITATQAPQGTPQVVATQTRVKGS